MYRNALLLLALLAGLFACGSERVLQGQISIASMEDGDWELYTVKIEEGRAYRLTDNRAYDSGAVWSPDGNAFIATTEWLAGEGENYQVKNDAGEWEWIDQEITSDRELVLVVLGNLPEFLTDNAANDEYPAWSPDGEQIAFSSDRTGDYEIFVMDPNGDNVNQLTNSPGEDWQPSWSPDGERIVFASIRTGDWAIYVMDSDGGNVLQLTDRLGIEWSPEWSPDGTRIAFAAKGETGKVTVDGESGEILQADPGGGTWEVYVMDSNGENMIQLTDHPSSNFEPTWSPDSKYLAFASDRSGPFGIYVMNADGNDLENTFWSGIPSDWTNFD
jgi:Tol biopolymer transport system component